MNIIWQALETDLIGTLLSLLETRLEGAAAAQLVRALKAMSRSGPHGERVRGVLARSPVWEHYAAQRHDLFITAASHNNTLAGNAHTHLSQLLIVFFIPYLSF